MKGEGTQRKEKQEKLNVKNFQKKNKKCRKILVQSNKHTHNTKRTPCPTTGEQHIPVVVLITWQEQDFVLVTTKEE